LFCLVHKNIKVGGKYYDCQKNNRRKITGQKNILWEVDEKNMVGGKYHDPSSFLSNGVNKIKGVNKSDVVYKSNGDW
jgi:hypothetical protein